MAFGLKNSGAALISNLDDVILENLTSGATEWPRLSRINFLFPWVFASYSELPHTLSSQLLSITAQITFFCHFLNFSVSYW